jgi:hypothetical protein
MRVDTGRIDERIQKLQEIKRIAADPEMVEMLFEFVDLDGESFNRRPAPVQNGGERPPSIPPDEARELVDQVMKAVPGSSHMNGRRS